MPPELGKLTNLQTLTCFLAGVTSPDCSDVAELHDLDLGGQLELCQAENVIEAEAKVANLGNKKDLRELRLRWTSVSESKVLDNFKPHDRMEVLKIYCYGGECMGMLQNMVEIHLFHCERLQFLFRCGTSFIFSKLKVLTLEHLLNFEGWWEINESQEEQIIFPVLEKLFIQHCGKLIALPEAPLLEQPCRGSNRWVCTPFSLLDNLFIRYCGKLAALREAPLVQEPCIGGYRLVRSAFPALKVLALENLKSFQRWGVAVEGEQILFPQLEKLSVHRCPKLVDFPEAPKLSVLEIVDGKQEVFHWVDRYLSSLTNLILKLEYTETTSEAECTTTVPVGSKEKWNQKSPITVMELGCCNSFLGAGAPDPWDYFVHLKDLEINRCDVLVHWPEKVFQSLVSLRRLVIKNCKNLTGYAEVPLEPSATERSQCLTGLESLQLIGCRSLVEIFNVPASLKRMVIGSCPKLESIFGKQQDISELVQGSSWSEAIMHAAVPELPSSPMSHSCPCLDYIYLDGCRSLPAVLNLPPSLKTLKLDDCSSIQVLACQSASIRRRPGAAATAAREHLLPPHLECLVIEDCAGMLGGTLRLPAPLRRLDIIGNSGLTSLEYLSGEHPPSLEMLDLRSCSTLASLPNEPQVYSSLWYLGITGCLAIKKLPRCLHQQLGSIDDDCKELDACYQVMALKPKTWKEIPRLVRERRQAAERARSATMQE